MVLQVYRQNDDIALCLFIEHHEMESVIVVIYIENFSIFGTSKIIGATNNPHDKKDF